MYIFLPQPWNLCIACTKFPDLCTFHVNILQCTVDYSGGGGFYYRLTSRRSRAKEVQVGCSSMATVQNLNLPTKLRAGDSLAALRL